MVTTAQLLASLHEEHEHEVEQHLHDLMDRSLNQPTDPQV